MAWEALNNIAAARDRPLIIVVNDNERSYGADHRRPRQPPRHPAHHRRLRAGPGLGQGRAPAHARRRPAAVRVAARREEGLQGRLRPAGHVRGPRPQVRRPDRRARHRGRRVGAAARQALPRPGPRALPHREGPRLPARRSTTRRTASTPSARWTRSPASRSRPSSGPSWTSVFGDEIAAIGAERPDVVAITAAMLHPVGLGEFAERFPERVWDVGIAEQHAAVCAAGLATGGLHPVVAVYATFLNRAFDQLLMDVALHRCGVTFVLDRAGVTGVDGPSHNGMWDMSDPPGRAGAADRRAARRRPAARPAARGRRRGRRADRGALPQGVGRAERSRPSTGSAAWTCCTGPTRTPEVLLVAVGVLAPGLPPGRRAARRRAASACTVVDPRWVKPVDPSARPARRRTPAGRRRRGQQSVPAASVRRSAQALRRRRGRRAAARLRHPRAVPRARQARRGAGRHRAHAGRDRGTDRRRLAAKEAEDDNESPDRREPERLRTTDPRGSKPKGFDLATLLAERGAERYELHAKYLNHQLPAHAAHHRLRQGLRAGRGRPLLGRRGQRLPRHARRLRGDGPRPPPPRRPQGAARRPRRLARRPDPLRLPAAARTARREAARAQPAPGPGVLRQQRHRGRGDRAEVRPVRHRQAPRPVLLARLPRPDHRLALGQRRGRLPRRLRAAAARHGPRRSAISTRWNGS